MKLSEIKAHLAAAQAVNFVLPNGDTVPEHFHVTEIGFINKDFIDCGGTLRNEKRVSFQLWDANDADHRLNPQKLLTIIDLSEKVLKLEDMEIEVEYQGDTIGKYALDFDGRDFLLISKITTCLASDKCGAPSGKQKLALADLKTPAQTACCSW